MDHAGDDDGDGNDDIDDNKAGDDIDYNAYKPSDFRWKYDKSCMCSKCELNALAPPSIAMAPVQYFSA